MVLDDRLLDMTIKQGTTHVASLDNATPSAVTAHLPRALIIVEEFTNDVNVLSNLSVVSQSGSPGLISLFPAGYTYVIGRLHAINHMEASGDKIVKPLKSSGFSIMPTAKIFQ